MNIFIKLSGVIAYMSFIFKKWFFYIKKRIIFIIASIYLLFGFMIKSDWIIQFISGFMILG